MKARGLVSTQQAWQLCDHFDVFVRGVKAVGSFGADAFISGLQKMGPIVEASTFRLAYTASRRDGVDQVAVLGWDIGCSCFKYVSQPYTVP
jgi:hypothetical protein